VIIQIKGGLIGSYLCTKRRTRVEKKTQTCTEERKGYNIYFYLSGGGY